MLTIVKLLPLAVGLFASCSATVALDDYDDIFDDQPLRILGLNLRDEVCSEGPRGRSGSCQPWDRCLKLNGVQGDSCAYGFGVCCYWRTSCGAQTSFKVSQFVNPSYPGSDTSQTAGDCRFTVRISDKRVCQLRLDLDALNLSEPEVTRSVARCTKQRFQVRGALGSNLGFVELCGDNSGQHLYIPVEASLGPTTVQIVISTMKGASAYRWKIRVTQVDCSKDKAIAAPTGCLQYHRGDRGSFRSLGYGRSSNYRGVPSKASMASGLDYAVCIQRSTGACGVRYASTAFNLPTGGDHDTSSSTPTSSTTETSTATTSTTTAGARIRTGKDPVGSEAWRVNTRGPKGPPRGPSISPRAAAQSSSSSPPFLFIPGGVLQGEGSTPGGGDGKFAGDSLAVSSVQSEMPGPVSIWVSSGRGGVNGTGFEVEYELLTTNC